MANTRITLDMSCLPLAVVTMSLVFGYSELAPVGTVSIRLDGTFKNADEDSVPGR